MSHLVSDSQATWRMTSDMAGVKALIFLVFQLLSLPCGASPKSLSSDRNCQPWCDIPTRTRCASNPTFCSCQLRGARPGCRQAGWFPNPRPRSPFLSPSLNTCCFLWSAIKGPLQLRSIYYIKSDQHQGEVSALGERSCRNASERTRVHLIKLSIEIPARGSMTPCETNCSNWGFQRIRRERGLRCAMLSLFWVLVSDVRFTVTRPLTCTTDVHYQDSDCGEPSRFLRVNSCNSSLRRPPCPVCEWPVGDCPPSSPSLLLWDMNLSRRYLKARLNWISRPAYNVTLTPSKISY